jgi:hypothetical protein
VQTAPIRELVAMLSQPFSNAAVRAIRFGIGPNRHYQCAVFGATDSHVGKNSTFVIRSTPPSLSSLTLFFLISRHRLLYSILPNQLTAKGTA